MMLDKKAPIGVIDSGVGGLSVLKCLHKMLPHEDFLYVGDTARTPYGVRPEAEIRSFVNEMLDWLESRGVKMVVIACNTLTMLGMPSLQKDRSFPIVGMSKGEELLLAASKNKKIGVMATPFTIGTQTHAKALHAADAAASVYPAACPDFVTLIEAGAFDSDALHRAITSYAAPLKEAGVDTVLLACTHFPFIREQLEAEFGEGVHIVDPAEATSLQAIALLRAQDLLRESGDGKVNICATADIERVEKLAAHMLPLDQCSFSEVVLHN